jgi:tyrosyl-tRNA synthetase
MEKEFFTRGVAEIIDEKSFKEKLASGKKLTIKMGFDPTRPDIHLGHAVGLWKLRELQDAGHKIVFLIGDYTTKIGDPSGRNTTRPVLDDKEIKENAKTYFEQVGKILDVEKAEVRYNSEWFSKMHFSDILVLAGKFTVAQIIERDDFQKRLQAGNDIGLHELLYPLMQAYDSVMLQADVEFGGTDQKFNLLAGRDLQRKLGQTPQDIMMVDLLVGTDGQHKMSKSLDNYIAIFDEPKEMYGKIMSIPDALMLNYFELATKISKQEIDSIKKELDEGKNPRDIKMKLAFEIVRLYHGVAAAEDAQEEFIKVFSNRELPTDIPEVKIEYGNYQLADLLILLQAVESKSEARRLIEQGGLKIDETKIADPNSPIAVTKDMLIQVGKRKIYRIK